LILKDLEKYNHNSASIKKELENFVLKPDFNEFKKIFSSEIKRIDENFQPPYKETIEQIITNQDKNKFYLDSKMENFQSIIDS